MMEAVPLGKAESQELEFKSRDSLAKPDTIAREVVAFLNADGGEVWVGIAEKNEFAVAVEVIHDATAAVGSLLDHLIDSIEPSPENQEATVESVPAPGGGAVIRVRVRGREDRRPYALRRKGGWHFVLRVGGRSRPMTREEVGEKFRGMVADEERVKELTGRILRRREKAQAGLWVAIQPGRDLELDLDDEQYRRFLTEPGATGNRQAGWMFANQYQRPERGLEELVQATGSESREMKRVVISREGSITLHVAKRDLAWQQNSLHPFALVEYPTSMFRLAACVFEHVGFVGGAVLADMALLDTKGLTLPPGSPIRGFFGLGEPRTADLEDVVFNPRKFDAASIIEKPDRCGARMWSEVYHAFGFESEAFPPEYDAVSGRLLMPE